MKPVLATFALTVNTVGTGQAVEEQCKFRTSSSPLGGWAACICSTAPLAQLHPLAQQVSDGRRAKMANLQLWLGLGGQAACTAEQ